MRTSRPSQQSGGCAGYALVFFAGVVCCALFVFVKVPLPTTITMAVPPPLAVPTLPLHLEPIPIPETRPSTIEVPSPFIEQKPLTTLAPPPPLPPPVAIRTGAIRKHRGWDQATLKIETPSGSNYLIKMVNVQTGTEELLVYIHGGESYDTKVPVGRYRFRIASGDVWYGPKTLFGPDTSYGKLEPQQQSDDIISFYISGRQIIGHTIMLQKQANGNLKTTPISANEF